eukprot:3160012-Ditylum_brightwellii.AAC.1
MDTSVMGKKTSVNFPDTNEIKKDKRCGHTAPKSKPKITGKRNKMCLRETTISAKDLRKWEVENNKETREMANELTEVSINGLLAQIGEWHTLLTLMTSKANAL